MASECFDGPKGSIKTRESQNFKPKTQNILYDQIIHYILKFVPNVERLTLETGMNGLEQSDQTLLARQFHE